MNYKELQEHIESLKPMLRKAEARYLSPLQEFDVVRKLELSRSQYKGLIHKARKLNYESIVSEMIHINKNMNPYQLAHMATNIAINLSWYGLSIPTMKEMEELLEKAELTGEEILKFKSDYMVYDLEMLPIEGKAAIVFFLSKVIFDALDTKNFDKLMEVNSLMREMGIMEDFSDRKAIWDDYVIKGIDHYVDQGIFMAIHEELDAVIEEKIKLFTAISEDIESETLDSVVSNPMKTCIRNSFFDEDIMKKRDAYSENRADFGEIIAKVLDDLDDFQLKIAVEKQELFDHVDSIAVAEGFYAALLNGDELAYIPIVHEILAQSYMRQSFPSVSFDLRDLDDEETWNYGDTASNGRKASNIYRDGDLLGVEVEDNRIDGYLTYTIPIRSYIADLTNTSVPESIDVRMSIVNRLKEYGLSARKARDIAVVIATLNAKRNIATDEDCIRALDNLYPAIKVMESKEESREIAKLDSKIADLEGKLRASEKEKKGYRHQIVSLEKEIKELNEKHNREIDQILTDTQFEDEKEELQVSDIEYPYHTEKKITLYGGFDVFHRELSKLMPDIKIVEPCYKSPNLDVFRNSDMVFIQPNKMNHGNYFSVRDAAKHANVPYYHLRFACARKCADFMVGAIEAAEMKE